MHGQGFHVDGLPRGPFTFVHNDGRVTEPAELGYLARLAVRSAHYCSWIFRADGEVIVLERDAPSLAGLQVRTMAGEADAWELPACLDAVRDWGGARRAEGASNTFRNVSI